MGESVIQQKSFEFALSIVRLYKKLQARQEFVLSPQLLRSGTGIGVKVEQATAEPTKQAFADKLSAASSDARETRYWLRLLQESKLADVDVTPELVQLDELIDMLSHPATNPGKPYNQPQ
ncbi:MAG TPA: four helix bundle protein [Allocoleopsis sp.]